MTGTGKEMSLQQVPTVVSLFYSRFTVEFIYLVFWIVKRKGGLILVLSTSYKTDLTIFVFPRFEGPWKRL